MTLSIASFGREYLQRRIVGEFAVAKHMGIVVESADDSAVVLRAPLAPNANHKGTAFGGSLYSVAVLAGWAWATRYLASREVSLGDLAVAAHLSALDYFGEVPWADFPAIAEWYMRMKSRPAFRSLLNDRIPGQPPVAHYSDPDA